VRKRAVASLAARVTHVPCHLAIRFLARIVKVMPFGFEANRFVNSLLQGRVIFRVIAQRSAQIGHILLAEAEIQLTRASQTHTIAAFTEIMGKGRDKADLLARFF